MIVGITNYHFDELVEKFGVTKCGYCGCDLHEDNTTIDHMRPKSRGGQDRIANLILCCRSCNATKRAKTVDEFRFYKSMCEFGSRTGVVFSQQQVSYLESIGVKLDIRAHTFPFEVLE